MGSYFFLSLFFILALFLETFVVLFDCKINLYKWGIYIFSRALHLLGVLRIAIGRKWGRPIKRRPESKFVPESFELDA